MAFTPILSDQPISYAASRSSYRNAARETLAGGSPVFFVPTGNGLNDYGYGGPRYKYGYTYNNCPSPEYNYNGNCTWWCWGRLYETMGTYLPNYGDANNWYDQYTGSKDTDASNIQPGDIIVLTDSSAGHVMFVEQVVGGTVYISQSAYSTRSVWIGKACLTTSYSKSNIYRGASLNIYKDIDTAYYCTVAGVLHTGGSGPGPGPTPTEDLDISISPSSYSVTMSASQTYVDFTYNIVITGIPDGESISGGNTYPGLIRVGNTGWSYSSYTVGGVTYQRASKSQVLRYTREHDYAYSTTKHMYFNLSYSTGTIDTDTPMYINVQATGGGGGDDVLYTVLKRRRKRGRIHGYIC